MKKHTNKTHHRHNNLISPSSLQHPPHLFNTNHTQPLHLTFKTKYSCFSPNHSTPIPNRKVTILTPTKSQSKYNMILYACTNEKYLIPVSVPILPHTTESYPTLHFSIPQTSSLYYTNNTHVLSLHTLMPLPTPHHCLYNSTSPQTSPPLHYNSTAYTLRTRHPHKPTLHLNPHIQLTIHYTTPTPTHHNHTIQQIRILTPITRSHYARPHSKATTETRSTHIHTSISIRTS